MTHDEAYRAGFQGRPLPDDAPDEVCASWQIGRARALALPLHQSPGRGSARPPDADVTEVPVAEPASPRARQET